MRSRTNAQAIDQEWDQLHQDLDQWRAGLTSCHRSSVHEALQGFAAGFADVTAQAGDLPRTIITRELADILIAAAEEEGAAFRQLRDRWQPDDTALFELVEQRRSDAASAQRNVEDRIFELREQLEAAADPGERAALREFSDLLEAVTNDWNGFHDDYAELQAAAPHLDAFTLIAQLDGLITQFDAIVETIAGLPAEGARNAWPRRFEQRRRPSSRPCSHCIAGCRRASLLLPRARFLRTLQASRRVRPWAAWMRYSRRVKPLLSESAGQPRCWLRTTRRRTLRRSRTSMTTTGSLLVAWDAFHQRYSDWRRTDGGCDRTEVLQSLDGFNLRMGDLGRDVRRLPQSSYLLPMYNLLVEAVDREEGAIRALRNSWRPFTVDAFKAVDQERVNANRLRRQADIGLQGLLDRS